MSIARRAEDKVKAWEVSWNGRHWWDMPGSDFDVKKMNFYLFRTGRLEWDEDEHPDAPLTRGGHRRLVLKSQSNYGRLGVTRSTINPAAEAAAKAGRKLKEADEVWRFALRQRIARVLKETGGSLRQIAVQAGVHYKGLHTFTQTGREVRSERLVAVAKVLDQVEAGALVLRNLHGAHLLTAARAARVPADCVSFKEFVEATAAARGVKVHAQYQYYAVNAWALPPRERINQRLVFVKRAEMEKAVAALKAGGFVDRRVGNGGARAAKTGRLGPARTATRSVAGGDGETGRTGRAEARTTNEEVAA